MKSFDVAVAVSGGLDSLMALYRLQAAGCKVLAVHGRFISGQAARLDGLRAACARLAVPLEIFDLRAEFRRMVMAEFAGAYVCGQTPNPCVVCNRDIKFGLLMDAALSRGAERFASGHYARQGWFTAGGRSYRTLAPAADAAKDQAYFLGLLPAHRLPAIIFPLAELSKTELKRDAAELGLAAPEPKESQEICFIPGDDYRLFLRERGAAAKPGPMLLADGREVGRHAGLWRYTEGQRRGLGVAHSVPLYVVGKDFARNALILGEQRDTLVRVWRAGGLNFFVPFAHWPKQVLVRTRYRQKPQPAGLTFESGKMDIEFANPHERPAPGQLAAFYATDGLLLGAGTGEAAGDG